MGLRDRLECTTIKALYKSLTFSFTFTHRVERFGNILGTPAVCVKILERNSRGSNIYVSEQVKRKGYEKLMFCDQYLTLSHRLVHYTTWCTKWFLVH